MSLYAEAADTVESLLHDIEELECDRENAYARGHEDGFRAGRLSVLVQYDALADPAAVANAFNDGRALGFQLGVAHAERVRLRVVEGSA